MVTKTFRGGVSLSEEKELTVAKKMRTISPPPQVFVPLSQHIGSPNEPVVNTGDNVKMGQPIGESKAFISSPVHSPVSGKIKDIKNFFNPVYGEQPAVIIENDGKDEAFSDERNENPQSLSRKEIIDIVRDKGVVGMGGAAFPTHVKLNIPEGKHVDTLIVNGAECEPYLTADHRLMVEKTGEILKGVTLVAKALNVKNIYFAIEENKLSAVFALEKTLKSSPSTRITVLKTKYPQGGEKQLIKAILKKEVPPEKLPLDVGVVVQNVGTCFAVYEAVYEGKPLIERPITFTGGSLKEPGNYIVRIGTLFRDVVERLGGFQEEPAKIIMGGPMMGIAQYSLDVPVMKGTTGVIFLSKKEAKTFEELPCIKCAKCVDICPVNLVPTEIVRMVKYSRWHYLDELHPVDCMECGSCAYSCPSRIPIVQYIKLAKQKAMEKK